MSADEPTVCLVRFTLRNEGHLPITATLPIEFSSRSQHTRHPYQDGARSGVPAGPRDALTLTNYPGSDGDANIERLLVSTTDGKPEVRGAIRTGMSVTTTSDGLVLRRELAPGESCEVLMKVARKAISTEQERASLARLHLIRYATRPPVSGTIKFRPGPNSRLQSRNSMRFTRPTWSIKLSRITACLGRMVSSARRWELMREVIEDTSQQAESPKARQELLRHVSLIQMESEAGALIDSDRERISRRSTELTELLQSRVS